jgi:hypothetical protein
MGHTQPTKRNRAEQVRVTHVDPKQQAQTLLGVGEDGCPSPAISQQNTLAKARVVTMLLLMLVPRAEAAENPRQSSARS